VVSASLDVDGNGAGSLFTDGILLARHMAGFSGAALTQGAIGNGAGRSTAEDVHAYLQAIDKVLDVNGHGQTQLFTDGILIARYLAGFSGTALTNNATGTGAARTDGTTIQEYLQVLLPTAAEASAVASITPSVTTSVEAEQQSVGTATTLVAGGSTMFENAVPFDRTLRSSLNEDMSVDEAGNFQRGDESSRTGADEWSGDDHSWAKVITPDAVPNITWAIVPTPADDSSEDDEVPLRTGLDLQSATAVVRQRASQERQTDARLERPDYRPRAHDHSNVSESAGTLKPVEPILAGKSVRRPPEHTVIDQIMSNPDWFSSVFDEDAQTHKHFHRRKAHSPVSAEP